MQTYRVAMVDSIGGSLNNVDMMLTPRYSEYDTLAQKTNTKDTDLRYECNSLWVYLETSTNIVYEQ